MKKRFLCLLLSAALLLMLLPAAAFADTAEYLYQHIAPKLAPVGIYTALVTGGTGTNKSTLPIPAGMKRDIKISDLNNGLSEEENKTLFHSVDIMEIVSLVLKGLKNIIK